MNVLDGMAMETLCIRFIGDPTGYMIRHLQGSDLPNGWIVARVGLTDRYVKIDVGKAYLIEEWSDNS